MRPGNVLAVGLRGVFSVCRLMGMRRRTHSLPHQGVTAGARTNQGEYGGKFLTDFSFDFTRLIGWQGLSAQVLTETRFGTIPNVVGVKVQPTTYLLTPKSSGTVFAVTGP